MNFRDRESSKFCRKMDFLFTRSSRVVQLKMYILFISPKCGVSARLYLGDDLSLFGALLLPAGEGRESELDGLECYKTCDGKMGQVDGVREVRLVWLDDFLMLCQSVMKLSVAPERWDG